MNIRLKTFASAGAAILLFGCATPDSVHQLAEVTSSNVGVFGTRLNQLSEESDRLYRMRAENVARMHAVNEQSRARYLYDLALTEKSGDKRDLDLKKELEAWKVEVDKIFAAAVGAEQQRRDALLAGEVKIDTKARALENIAETLSVFAKEESRKERVRALRKFASEVRDDAKNELDSGTASANAAKSLLDEIRGK